MRKNDAIVLHLFHLIRHYRNTTGREQALTTSRKVNGQEFNIRIVAFKDRMFRFAKSILRDSSEAEDATQDTLEKLWRRRESLDRCDNIDAFVIASVKNVCYDRLRSRRAADRRNEVIRRTAPATVSPQRLDDCDLRELLERTIAALPDRQREAMHLRDIEGCDMEEIAQIMGCDQDTVRVTLSRARKRIKEEMLKIMNYGI